MIHYLQEVTDWIGQGKTYPRDDHQPPLPLNTFFMPVPTPRISSLRLLKKLRIAYLLIINITISRTTVGRPMLDHVAAGDPVMFSYFTEGQCFS